MEDGHDVIPQECIQAEAKTHGYVIDHIGLGHCDGELLHGLGEVHDGQDQCTVQFQGKAKDDITFLILGLSEKFEGLLRPLSLLYSPLVLNKTKIRL